MTEHSAHAPHHSHVRKAIDQLQEKHAALVDEHRAHAAAVAEARAARIAERAAAAQDEQQP